MEFLRTNPVGGVTLSPPTPPCGKFNGFSCRQHEIGPHALSGLNGFGAGIDGRSIEATLVEDGYQCIGHGGPMVYCEHLGLLATACLL